MKPSAITIFHDLAPYKKKIDTVIDSLPFFCILFDESLNEILQQEQLDVHIDFGSHHSIL